MKKQKIKIAVLSILLMSMFIYIGWVFYISEPTYIDNCYKKLEKFDYVSMPVHEYYSEQNSNKDVENGIILQVDSFKAIMKSVKWDDTFTEIDLKQHKFRIIGKGTLYHKINSFVGMDIMLITQIFMFIICIVLIYTIISILKDII